MSGESRCTMAVTKIWPVKSRLGHVIQYAENTEKTAKSLRKQDPTLEAVLSYARNRDKTEQEYFVTALNCYEDTVREQFEVTKKRFGKTDGILAYHGYMSFTEEEVTPEQAHAIGVEVAERLWGDRFQVVVTTHLNTKCLHNHFVINSVSFKDGKRCRGTSWFKNREIIDEICKAHGLSVVEKPDRNPDPAYWKKGQKEGIPTRYEMVRSCIDEAIQKSNNLKAFERELMKLGFEYRLSPNRKYWTVNPKGWKRPIRLYRLGSEYTNQRIKERIHENVRVVPMEDFQAKNWDREKRILPPRKKSSLQGLYLHYCYLLGILPKKKILKFSEVHYALRDELLRLDHISEATQLLCNNQIDSAEQLVAYKNDQQQQISLLSEERQELRKKLRRKDEARNQAAIRERIHGISDKLKELRKEVALCNEIYNRSEIMERQLETMEQEEKDQGKDVKKHEYRW